MDQSTAYKQGFETGKALMSEGSSTVAQFVRYWRDGQRCLARAVGWSEEVVAQKVQAFHRERIDAEPDLNTYPELRGARDDLLATYRGMRDVGVPDDVIVLSETLNFWRDTRLVQETGRAYHPPTTPEKCRVVYVPETSDGALHAKNVDDPLTYWQPRPPYPPGSAWPWTHPLWFDGVGSGLHVDEMPPEIFPVKPIELCKQHCTTVAEAEEFMVRYNYFWSSQNLLVHDAHGNSVAFEKTRCRVAARGPNEKGINFITGMGALDPGIRAFQKEMRQKYLDQIGETWDGPDGAFWKICQGKWDNMTRYIGELSRSPSAEGLMELMEQRDPSGPMCPTGIKSHPDDVIAGCTLVMDLWFVDRKKLHRRQWRGETPAYLDTPEIVEFTQT